MEEMSIEMIAMEMILAAGDCRALVKKGLAEVLDGNASDGIKKLEDAKKELRKAHEFQTNVLQNDAEGDGIEYSVLFSHAQDTVMTIASELNIAFQLASIYEKLNERITALEVKND